MSDCNGVVILCNKNKTGAIVKTHVLCLVSNFLLHEMSHIKKALVVKSYWWHMEKIIIYWEIIMSHNLK